MTNTFGRLEELIIHAKMSGYYNLGSSMTFLLKLLSYCANLQTLEMRHISYACPYPHGPHIELQQAVSDLKKLRSLKLDFVGDVSSLPPVLTFYMKVLTSIAQGKNLLNLWIPDCENALEEAIRLKRFALTDLASSRALFISEGCIRTSFNPVDVSESCEFKCRKLGIHNKLSAECMEFLAKKFVNVKEFIMHNGIIDSEEHISMLAMISVRWENITHLNFISCQMPKKGPDVCATLANMKALTHLSVNGCLIATSAKNRPTGSVTDSPDALPVEELAGLGLLTKECPWLQYLEISGTCCRTTIYSKKDDMRCRNGCSVLKDKDLKAIFQWKCLKSLTLKHLHSLIRCEFLIAVGKNCPLQTLRLQNIGVFGKRAYNACLIATLHHCTNLLDFSIWQDCLNLDSLFAALLECSTLVRIVVVDAPQYPCFDGIVPVVAKMITRLQNLLVFYLTFRSFSEPYRTIGQTHLHKKFSKDRPALSVVISNSTEVYDHTYPVCHLEEMLFF